MISHAKKQEDTTYNEMSQSTEIESELTQMLELADH